MPFLSLACCRCHIFLLYARARTRRRAFPGRDYDDHRDEANFRVLLQAETSAGQLVLLRRGRARFP